MCIYNIYEQILGPLPLYRFWPNIVNKIWWRRIFFNSPIHREYIMYYVYEYTKIPVLYYIHYLQCEYTYTEFC